MVPPFFASPSRKLTLSGHQTMTAAVTGFPDFPTVFQKIDSKMCFTINCYLFPPARDSLQHLIATLLFDVVDFNLRVIYTIIFLLSIIFL